MVICICILHFIDTIKCKNTKTNTKTNTKKNSESTRSYSKTLRQMLILS